MRALVVGMDGSIGHALRMALLARGDCVTGTSRRPGRAACDIRLDLGEPASVDVELPPVDIAFFCAGMTRFAECRSQPDRARQVNVTTPVGLAQRLVRHGSRVVLLSTSAVLDCAEPHMSGDRALAPATSYGKSKAEAEAGFLSLGADAAVLRLTKVLVPESELFTGWIAALARGERVSAFDDLRFSPIALLHVVGALVAIADRREGGVFQLSGASDMSYADAARYLAGRLGVPADLVAACSALDSGIPAEEVTAYTSLDTRRLSEACGFAAPEPQTVIDAVFRPSIEMARAAL